jgi:hypothetical protein
MKKHLFTLIITVFCANLYAATRSKAPDPTVFTININKEEAWKRLLELLVSNNVPLKFTDKNAGVIQSDCVGLGSHYSLVNADHPRAWALCETLLDADTLFLFPKIINGALHIGLREIDDKNVEVSINLTNIAAIYRDSVNKKDINLRIASTRRLEKIIADYLATPENMPKLAFDLPLATFGESPYQKKKRAALVAERRMQTNKRSQRIAYIALVCVLVLRIAPYVFQYF